MTVNFSLAVSGPYTCDGATTDFAFTYRLISAAHLVLTVYNATTGVVVSTLTGGAGYSVLAGGLKNDAGGTVRLTTAPAAGNKISIARAVPYSQPNRIGNQGAFLPETHETTFDLLAMQIQQLSRKIGGGMTLPIVDDPTLDMTLPNTVARAGRMLGFDTDGKPVAGGLVSDLANLSSSVSAAAISAAASATSAGQALGYRNDAQGYAAAAAASAAALDTSVLLSKAGNLAGLANVGTARANLGLPLLSDAGGNLNKVVTTDGAGKLPALDGSALLNVAGKLVKTNYAEYTAWAAMTALIPFDDTIPQNTEGTQLLTITVTTTTATQKVRLRAQAWAFSSTGSIQVILALFRTGNANAIAASADQGAAVALPYYVEFEDAPGAAGTYTYTVRIGPSGAASVYVNGNATSRMLGGASRATLIADVVEA